MNQSGGSIRAVHPLFQEEGGGSIPTSPLQLNFHAIDKRLARSMVFDWHSKLPELTNWQTCNECYGAEYDGAWYAAAMWGAPIAREFNGRGYLELRRFAINDKAPRNTASRMLGWMLRRLRQHYVLAISYQDTDVHLGTIYKASGWKAIGLKKNIGTGWNTRDRSTMQTSSDKIRWEYPLAGKVATSAENLIDNASIQTTSMELFADNASGPES